MITWIRSAAIAPGKTSEAFAFVRRARTLIAEKHGIDIAISRPLAGNPTRIFWSSVHADLASYARDHQTINTDTEFQQMLGEVALCFIAGSTHDEILQSL